MSGVVTKSSPVVVGTSAPGTPTGDVQLSRFDKISGCAPVSSILVFDKPIDDPVDTIRRALSRALVHYHPISGRLAAGADGGEVIACTGEGQGVLFVSASASCAVDGVLPPALLKDLFVQYPEEFCCRRADPLLLMQVTEFSCGGFAVGVSWNHALADGAGMGQFLQAVGELARGMSAPSVAPVRSDGLVLAAHPRGMAAADFASAELTRDLAYVDLTIPESFISRVKAEVSAALGEPCTVFEAVVAVVWRCRARAVISDVDPERPASLVFGCNVRGPVGAPVGYYGNCLVAESVVAAVANGDIKDIVKLIKIAKQKIHDNIRSGDVDDPVVRQPLGYSTLLVSSWRNLGLEAPDFGGGRPARVVWYVPQVFMPVLIICPPCKGHNGVNVTGYIVKKGHVDAFLHELATMSLNPGCGYDQ
ncbi:hypothetical protein ACQ4PT_037880 [Festuca glaucescens]